MRINTRLKIITTSSFLVILLISLVLFFFTIRLSKVTEKDAAVDLIAKGMAELEILTYDYLLHKEKRAKEQWQIKYDSLESVLKLTEFDKPDEQVVVESIHNNLENIKTMFTRLITGYENREYLPNEQKSASVQLEERLISRILLELREMVSNTFLLVTRIHSELITIERLEAFLIIVLSFTVFIVIAVISLNVSTAIAKPIAEMEKGAAIIGAGNLDHKVGSDANDEIGELSRSFDEMTIKLKDSRTVLEQEISERKKAEEALRLFERIVSLTGDHMSFVSKDYVYQSVNSAYLKAHEKISEDIIGHSVSELLGKEIFEGTVKHNLDRCLNGEVINYQAWFEFPVPGRRFMDVSYYPYYEINGAISGVVVSSHDITERKKAEEQVRASLMEKEVLLKEIHHRVKNNMAVVSSLLNLQADKVENEHYREMFNDSISRIKTMALIHEKLYRSEDLAKINFSDYINDMADTMYRSYRLSSSKVSLKKDIEEISLRIDAAIPCGLIVNELLSNSLKHAFPDGREGEIKVALSMNDKDEVELAVSDNGVGIPQNLDFRNTGSLGMTLVNALAGQLQAKIELNREQGTEFIITFRE